MSSSDRPDTANTSIDKARADEIIAGMPDLIFEFDGTGRFCAFHGGNPDKLYVPPDEFLGRTVDDVLPAEAAEKLQAAIDAITETGRPQRVNYTLPMGDDYQFFECRLFPLTDSGSIAIVRNITDSWRAKTELEQSEARYRTLVNNLPGLVYRCLIDEDWTAVFMSQGVEDILGYPAEEFLGRHRTLAQVTHPEDRLRVQREVHQAVNQKIPFQLSYRMIDADGNVRHVSERGQAVYAEHDAVNYLDGVVFDVTEIHQMRQRVLVNSKMAAVGNLAAGVAHEINNPLAIAMANLEYVTEELGDVTAAVANDAPVHEALGDVGRAVNKVQEGIDRVRTIIDDMRTFSDAAESRADQIDLKRLVDWALWRSDSRADFGDTVVTCLEDVPSVWASEVGIVQIIWNLLDNALEAIADLDDGSVEVSLTHDDDHVYLKVVDNGPGMSPEIADRAFEPFYTTKQVGQGAGLGLFVCQGLVEGMDGEISLQTDPGEGTRVIVSFPVSSMKTTAAGE